MGLPPGRSYLWGPPLLPDALHFILEALIVGISLFRANEMQDREHIVGDTLVHVPQIGDVPSAVFGCVMQVSIGTWFETSQESLKLLRFSPAHA
jgi:hypothetical protein